MINENVDVNELARVMEPEAWTEADKCEARGMTVEFETNIKILKSMTYARKAIQYIYYGKV